MKGPITSEHRTLEEFFEDVEEAMSAGNLPAASEAFAQLRRTLEAHVEQEDRLYYPAIRSLRPEFDKLIARFSKEHSAFRHEMATIQTLLETGARADAKRAIESFRYTFTLHEAAEESMLESLDRPPEIIRS